MPTPLSVYLVRHGESEANLDKSVNAIKADHLVELSAKGHEQAARSRREARRYFGRGC